MGETGPRWGSLTEKDVERLRQAVRRAVARYCPAALAGVREDVAQSALASILDIWRRHEERSPPEASYVLRVAYTAILKELRRLQHRAEVPLEATAEVARNSGDPGGPEQELVSKQTGQAIRDCLRGLAEPRRAAVVLYLHGFSLEHAARALETSAKVTDNNRYRGLRDLRVCLERKGFKR